MVIDAPARSLVNFTVVKNVLDGYLPLVAVNEVFERNGSFKADKRGRKVEKKTGVATFFKDACANRGVVKALPATARRIDLVGLEVASVFEVVAVLVDEVPKNAVHVLLSPLEPIFSGRLNVKHGPAVKLSRVHFTNLVLSAMLATVDGCDDERLRVQVPAVQLAAIGQFKEALSDFHRRAVHFIEEETHRLLASSDEPVRRVPSGAFTTIDGGFGGVRQTEKVAFGHLRGAPFNDR